MQQLLTGKRRVKVDATEPVQKLSVRIFAPVALNPDDRGQCFGQKQRH